MRYHRRFPAYALKHDELRLRHIVQPDALLYARAEPTWANRHEAELDLVFERDGDFATISFALIDGVMLLERESDPIVWPGWMRGVIDGAITDELNERLYPWLRSRVLSRFENAEFTRTFRADPALGASLDRARAGGLLGAASLVTVARSLAPAMYATRFAPGRSALVTGRDGANAAALLAGRFERVAFDPADGEWAGFVRRWFGSSVILEPQIGSAYDVYIGSRESDVRADVRVYTGIARDDELQIEFAQPVPLGVLVSFDPEDSISAGEFAVSVSAGDGATERTSRLSAPVSVGGSTGHIALVVRDDALRIVDADTDAALALQAALRSEGFDAEIYGAGQVLHAERVDLVHVIGHRHAEAIGGPLRALRAAGKPIVVMPYLDDPEGACTWGMTTTASALRESTDEAIFEQYFDALAVRRLVADLPAPVANATAHLDDAVLALFGLAGAMIVSSGAEADLLRRAAGYAGACIEVPALVRSIQSQPVAHIVGFREYVLLHGPIDPRTNVLSAILAAQDEGLPVVALGSVANADYYAQVVARSSDRVVFLNEKSLDQGQTGGVYARARVFADVSWAGTGLHRLARAGAAGSTLVGSQAGYAGAVWGDLVEVADPASLPSIRRALRGAWDAATVRGHAIAALTAKRCDQQSALVQVVTAYQQAAAAAIP